MAERYRFVVLGDPISHSRSPAIHNAALAALGIEGTYRARRVDAAGMRDAAEEIRRGSLDGANITMPHKEMAFGLSDRVEGPAVGARSVNTWSRSGAGELIGRSTDIPAIVDVWQRRGLGAGPVLILGSGGAAAAALVALDGRELVVSARRMAAALDLVQTLGVKAEVLPWGSGARAVIVNCTPLGMHGESLPHGVVESATGLFEMTYGSGPTPAEILVSERGLPVADGLDLLVAQAAMSFEIWTGVSAPVEAMEQVARNDSRQVSRPPNH